MPKEVITIDTIFEGFTPSEFFGAKGQYSIALGIDPDMPATDSAADLRSAGMIRPVQYKAFSGAAINSHPIAIVTNPKNSNVYVVLSNGKLVRYDENLENETTIGTVGDAAARGAWYYNNYLWITTPTNLSKYGPMDASPVIVDNVWTGYSLTALTDTAYPQSLLGIPYLNHFGISHLDGASYLLDYKNGVGMVHKLLTKKVGGEGDTNDGSAYNLLDLPFNYLPVSLSSYGNDLVVAASFTTDDNILQGKAALFFFNPADDIPSFYRVVYLPDALCSTLKYANGSLFGLSGDIGRGYRLFQYVGGDTIQTLKMVEEGNLPLQGASDLVASRFVWAADTTIPMVSSGMYAFGSKSDQLPRGLHHVAMSGFTT